MNRDNLLFLAGGFALGYYIISQAKLQNNININSNNDEFDDVIRKKQSMYKNPKSSIDSLNNKNSNKTVEMESMGSIE